MYDFPIANNIIISQKSEFLNYKHIIHCVFENKHFHVQIESILTRTCLFLSKIVVYSLYLLNKLV